MKSNKAVLLPIGVFLLGIGLLGLAVVCALYVVSINVRDMYAVVLDAGSTSTKLTLYKWRDDPFRTNGNVEQIALLKQSPGISNYLSNPSGAYTAIEPNLKELMQGIPEDQWSSTPVYLAATAGMRLALLMDPLGSMKLFEVLRRGLLTSGLDVETPNERIRMLSGTEEGLYGWVSVNSILDLITINKQVQPKDTQGSLDMGGASTQIAFIPADAGKQSLETSVKFTNLKLFGSTYNVYSHSFLCYGKNEFEKRTMGAIIGTTATAEIANPCYFTGYTVEKDSVQLFDGPCMSGSYAKKTFGAELIKPAALNKFTFKGTGDPVACKEKIESQFQTGNCTYKPCSFNNVYQPPVSGLFRAYSGFSYVIKYLFPNQTTGFTKKQVDDAVLTFCRKPWSEINTTVDPGALNFAALYCFDGLYVSSLLNHYGFKTDEQWKTITFNAKINGKTASWALGYMLDQSGYLPTESPKINMSMPLFVSLLIIMLLIISTGIACIAISRKK